MANTTIEDVLDRNGIGGAHWSYRNSVIAAMQEYASLQTPSNENYWRELVKSAHYAGWYNGMVNAYKHEFSWAEFSKANNL